jgi:hypothetical protein
MLLNEMRNLKNKEIQTNIIAQLVILPTKTNIEAFFYIFI